MEWKNEKRKIGELIKYDKNPRKITDKQKAELEKSLKKFNVVEIPAINLDNNIIAGHQRITVLLKLYGPDYEIDVRVPNRILTEKEYKEYLIRSNKNIGEFDYEYLKDFDVDLLTDSGFYPWEVSFKDFYNTQKVRDKQLDEYTTDNLYPTIKCGDAIEDIKTKNDNYFDIILCDPPYNLGSELKTDPFEGTIKYSKSSDYLNKWEGLTEDQIDTFFKESYRVLKFGGYILLFGMDRQLPIFSYYGIKNNLEPQQSLYWIYNTNIPKGHKIKTSSEELTLKYKNYVNGKAPLKQFVETILVFKKKNKHSVIKDIELNSPDTHPSVINVEKFGDIQERDGRPGHYPSQVFIEDKLKDTFDTYSEKFSDQFIKIKYEEEDINQVLFATKPQNNERDAGLKEGVHNPHITIKPINLVKELFKLFKTPTPQKIYVPFSGVGSEVIGIMKSGVSIDDIEGIELDPVYHNVSMDRIKWWEDNDIIKK